MPQPPKYQKTYERPKAEDVFTDREQPFAVFEAARSAIETDRPKLLIFYGIGGQGKSALCGALIRRLEREEPRCAAFGLLRIEGSDTRPHEALLDLRLSMGESSGVHFHAFDIAFSAFWAQAYPEQDLRNYRKGRISRALDYLPDFAKETAQATAHAVPFLPMLIRIGRWLTEKGHEKWAQRTIPLLRDLNEGGQVMPPDQIVDRLPLFLATDLNGYLMDKPGRQVVVFIDEYERLWEGKELKAGEARQPVDEAIKELVANCPGIMFVVFSRERLHWDRDHSGWIEDLKDAQHLLGGLSSTDAEAFLIKCGVAEQPLRQAMIEGAGGEGPEGCHPELLDLAVDHYFLMKIGSGRQPQQEFFRTGSISLADRRRKLVHRFLRGCDDRGFRDTLRYLAATESFDRALFDELVRGKTGFAPSGFDHLVSYSFVQGLEGERYRLHPRMAEVLVEDLRPEQYREVHDFYFYYYDGRCRPSSPSAIAPKHEAALSAAARHLLALDKARFPGWLSEVGDIFYEGARFRLLQPLSEKAMAITEEALGPGHLDVAMSLENLALLHCEQGHFKAASPYLERALSIREKELGLDHPDVASILNLLALLHRDQGRYKAASPLFERALAIWEKAIGPEHPDVATSLINLANLYSELGRYKAALPLLERSLVILEKALGPEHPDVAGVLNNLAVLHSEAHYEAGLTNYEQVWALYEGNKTALPLLERALAITEKALGPEHPDVATTLNNLAGEYRDLGRYKAALPFYERALAILEKALGREHPRVATSLNGLAMAHRNQGRYEAALPVLERVLAIREKALGPEHPRVATTRENLADLQRKLARSKTSQQ